MLRYLATAALLGAGWFAVLLVPAITRGFVLQVPLQSLTFLVLSSVTVSAVFVRFVASAHSFSSHLGRALLLSYAGCVLFLTLTAAAIWAHSLLADGLANVHDTVSLYVMGLTAATISGYVVIPYALLCQYALHRTLRTASPGFGGAVG